MTVLTFIACGLFAGAVVVPGALWLLGWALQALARMGLFGEDLIKEAALAMEDWLTEAASWWLATLSPYLFAGASLFIVPSMVTWLLTDAGWSDFAWLGACGVFVAIHLLNDLFSARRGRMRRAEEFAVELGAFAPPAAKPEEPSARNLFVERTLAELLAQETAIAAAGVSGEKANREAWKERARKLDAIASRYLNCAEEVESSKELEGDEATTHLANLAWTLKRQRLEALLLMGRARQRNGQPIEFVSLDGPSQVTVAEAESALRVERNGSASNDRVFGPQTVRESPLYAWLARRIGEVQAAAALLDVAEVFPTRSELAAALNELFPSASVTRGQLDKWLAQPSGRIWAKLRKCQSELRAIAATLDLGLDQAA